MKKYQELYHYCLDQWFSTSGCWRSTNRNKTQFVNPHKAQKYHYNIGYNDLKVYTWDHKHWFKGSNNSCGLPCITGIVHGTHKDHLG